MEKTINLQDLYDELKRIEKMMVTKAELERALETVAVLSNENTTHQILESEEDIKAGRIKKINSINDI